MVNDELVAIGTEFANLAFNWAQTPGHVLTERDCVMLRDAQKRWDAAVSEANQAAPVPAPIAPQASVVPSREEVWLRIYAALAGALGADGSTARVWADRALEAFDERFPPK